MATVSIEKSLRIVLGESASLRDQLGAWETIALESMGNLYKAQEAFISVMKKANTSSSPRDFIDCQFALSQLDQLDLSISLVFRASVSGQQQRADFLHSQTR